MLLQAAPSPSSSGSRPRSRCRCRRTTPKRRRRTTSRDGVPRSPLPRRGRSSHLPSTPPPILSPRLPRSAERSDMDDTWRRALGALGRSAEPAAAFTLCWCWHHSTPTDLAKGSSHLPLPHVTLPQSRVTLRRPKSTPRALRPRACPPSRWSTRKPRRRSRPSMARPAENPRLGIYDAHS